VTKRELVIDVAERLGYTQNEVANVVQATLEAITESLIEGQRIEVRNFGVFEVKKRDARMGRNPRTGEEVPIAEKRVATFKAGKALKERVESGAPQRTATPNATAAASSPSLAAGGQARHS
jgi:nucleoid DNA-binding protein